MLLGGKWRTEAKWKHLQEIRTKRCTRGDLGELCRCTGEQKVKLGQRFKRKSNVIKSGKMEGDGS